MPESFEIAYPWVLAALPLPLLVYWLLPATRLRSASLFLPTYVKAQEYTGQKPRKAALVRRRGLLSWIVLTLSWVLLLAALASPQRVGQPELKVKTSRNFLIAADISFSMAQKDWNVGGQPVRRWDAVKDLLHDFIQRRAGDRMGLLFFATNAYIQAPFTPDLETVDQLLEEADVGMAGQMTHIGKAITKGVEMFANDTIETKVMLLLTDGVDAGTEILPLDAADLARQDSVIIYTIGIGEPGRAGSDLDERTLMDIAELTDGQYFLARNADRLEAIYAEVDSLEPIEYEEEANRPVTLLYPYPLAGALGLLILLALLRSGRQALRVLTSKREEYV